MGRASQVLDVIEASLTEAHRRGLGGLAGEDERLDGRSVRIGEQDRLNFASCSYLGLELDPRLKAGAIDAVERYGTQFSCSRAYLAAPQYPELEELLGTLTGGHAMVTANTTLAHLSALPVVVGEEDAVILDHQVHHSVQLVIPQLTRVGAHVEFIRHDNLDQLEERICALRGDHRKIWLLADGVYSMFGDLAPMAALSTLLERYEQLHLYIDDAHGMSWLGTHGRGWALEELRQRERCIVALSLNKAFGAGGGALIFSSAEERLRIRKLGGPMVFTGPVQPPLLGAAVASAKIHLSEDIVSLQRELVERIRYAHEVARELDLPLANQCEVPVRYLALGRPVVAYDMAEKLMQRGLITSVAIFPAVPAQRSGVRFTLTRHQTREDIRTLLETIAELLPETLAANGSSREEIGRSFAQPLRAFAQRRRSEIVPARGLAGRDARLQCEKTIRALDRDEWNRCLGARGSFSWEALCYLEDVFGRGEKDDVDDWGFHYYLLRDKAGELVLATFFTDAIWKDDMLAEPRVSKRVEAARRDDPRFLTSRVLSMGAPLTEGDHLYLRRDADWRDAMAVLLDEIALEGEACQAASVVLRDLPNDDPALERVLADAGFARVASPASMELAVDWQDEDEFLARLSSRSRRFQRRYVVPHEEAFEVEVLTAAGREPTSEEWAQLHELYRNVQARNLELNTFPLPDRFLPTMFDHHGWEIVTLTIAESAREAEDEPVGPGPHAFVACYVGEEQYVPLVVGLDYAAVGYYGAYRQCIRQVIRRAEAHGSSRILFGMGAELEKARFGARKLERVAYVKTDDHYQHDVLGLLAMESGPRE